jgi:hypothetical protein
LKKKEQTASHDQSETIGSLPRHRKTFVLVTTVALIIFLLTSGIVLVEETGGGNGGDFHCYVGAVGVALVVLSLIGGFLSSGRFGRIKGWRPGEFHYPITVVTAVYLTGEFVLGMMNLNWSILLNLHLVLGVSIPVLAWLTVLLSPCLGGKLIAWKATSKIHVALSLLLILLVIVQVLYAYLIMGG